ETFSIDNVSVPLAQGLACPQEINLKQSATNIPSGGSYNYGSVNLGSNNSKVFTIENTGSFTLTLTGTPPNYVVKGGTNPGDFAITQPVTGTITGDNSTTFTVVFTPGGLGARSCTLSIGNSDSNENPYTLTLNGTGICPAITFTGTPTATCTSTTNGQIVVSGVSGGTAPYQYSKDNGASYQLGATFAGLAPGTYQVVVKDANNCTSGATAVTVGSHPIPSATISALPDPVCQNSVLNLSVPSAGSGATYAWVGNGVNNTSANTTTASPTLAGPLTYSVTVTTALGCVNSGTAQVTVNAAPGCPATFNPANLQSGVSGAALLTWSAVAGATGYRITFGDNAPAYNNTVSGLDLGNVTSYDPLGAGNLLANHTYGYTVTPYNACGDATGCPLLVFTTSCAESFLCPAAQDVPLNTACSVTIPDLVTGLSSNCGTLTFTQSPTASTVLSSSHNATISVTINASNATSCMVTLTAKDVTAPLALCQAVTANLLGNSVTVTAAQLNNGSTDNCPAALTLSPSSTVYTCANIGANTSVLTVTDAAGNASTCAATVTVADVTAPTLNCQPANITLSAGGTASITTADVFLSGTDNCGSVFQQSVAPNTFTCANLGANVVVLTVQDDYSNPATCTAVVTVSASAACGLDFSGKIIWEHDDISGVNNATVNLTGSGTGSDGTDVNGNFSISLPAGSGSFVLKPVKNVNKLNGVTVGDATAIQQHVAAITLITDPYKMVCADVNKSNSISTLDASIINQTILGNPVANAQFSSSWRFVPSSHTMASPPWGFPEQRSYTAVSSIPPNQDFIGMKIGDVTSVFCESVQFRRPGGPRAGVADDGPLVASRRGPGG
ncbi:MAG: choice-of-anchor D domain-containing protein, partial [Saprospiraceae bacterium]|nr:choice-of-anchor D domain-containing protein [Saprospiraceae bacterium]